MRHFINLTNGIEYLPELDCIDGFVRIQSTACEQKRWWFIIADLDYTFLLAAACDDVTVYDTSQKRDVSRACWQGIEWINYVLSRYWLREEINPTVRNGQSCLEYFRQCYRNDGREKDAALKKLRYVRELMQPIRVKIVFSCRQTNRDGQREWYREFLRNYHSGVE